MFGGRDRTFADKVIEIEDKIKQVRMVLSRESLTASLKSEEDKANIAHRIKDMQAMLYHLES